MTRPSDVLAPSATRVVDAAAADDVVLGGRYVLGTRVGEGGMGVVYQAHDRMLQRTVAVKIFRAGATEAARTATETQFLAGLNHPSLVTLFDAHVGDPQPRYLVMEYVDGPTLGQRLVNGPLRARTVRTIARDIGDALHAVHDAGIVHRDVKPSNVLLRPSTVPGEDFHAKLADFGIAHLVDSTRQTDPGTLIGSAAYLSPEQVTGAPPAFAADIYSLGLLILESLTGHRAFAQGTASEAALVRLTQDPVVPDSLGHDWSALLTEMTARDPARRPTARDVVAAVSRLGPIVSGESAIVTAYAPAQPGEEISATAAASKTIPLKHPAQAVENSPTPAPPVRPASDAPKRGALGNTAWPERTDRHADPRRQRRRGWIIASGIAIVLFIAAMTLTVGMLGRGVGSQADVPPVIPPAATNAATTPTARATPAPAPAARPATTPAPAPAPHTVRAATGTVHPNVTNTTGNGGSSGKDAKNEKNGKAGKHSNGKGKGNGG